MTEGNGNSFFMKTGNTFRVTRREAIDLHNALPGGNYTVKQNEMSGELYLEMIDPFALPTKMYGDCLKNTDRVINTFLNRTASTGVMLTGEKGSGKTLLSKNISLVLARDHNVPTIVINAPWHGEKFNTFIQSIDQPCVILFDEFEKVYDRNEQEAILTLLDGVYPTKKLFILTCNDKYRVDSHMRNRPGRIFYMLDFTGLTPEFIREYCEDNLLNKTHIDRICAISSMFAQFNFDMLKALVEEMNRYDETPQQALRMLNVKAEFDGGTEYKMEVVHQGKTIEYRDTFEGNPLGNNPIEVSFDPEPENDDSKYVFKNLTMHNLQKVDALAGKFVFEDQGTVVTLTRVQEKQPYRFYDAF
jgi:ATPase family associated with various cellular activities (AAA)